jgi:hypothetical protein
VIVTGSVNKPIIAPDVEKLAQMKLNNLLPTSGNPAALTSGLSGLLGGKGGQQQGNPVQGLLGALGGKQQQPEADQQQPANGQQGTAQQQQQQQNPAVWEEKEKVTRLSQIGLGCLWMRRSKGIFFLRPAFGQSISRHASVGNRDVVALSARIGVKSHHGTLQSEILREILRPRVGLRMTGLH